MAPPISSTLPPTPLGTPSSPTTPPTYPWPPTSDNRSTLNRSGLPSTLSRPGEGTPKLGPWSNPDALGLDKLGLDGLDGLMNDFKQELTKKTAGAARAQEKARQAEALVHQAKAKTLQVQEGIKQLRASFQNLYAIAPESLPYLLSEVKIFVKAHDRPYTVDMQQAGTSPGALSGPHSAPASPKAGLTPTKANPGTASNSRSPFLPPTSPVSILPPKISPPATPAGEPPIGVDEENSGTFAALTSPPEPPNIVGPLATQVQEPRTVGAGIDGPIVTRGVNPDVVVDPRTSRAPHDQDGLKQHGNVGPPLPPRPTSSPPSGLPARLPVDDGYNSEKGSNAEPGSALKRMLDKDGSGGPASVNSTGADGGASGDPVAQLPAPGEDGTNFAVISSSADVGAEAAAILSDLVVTSENARSTLEHEMYQLEALCKTALRETDIDKRMTQLNSISETIAAMNSSMAPEIKEFRKKLVDIALRAAAHLKAAEKEKIAKTLPEDKLGYANRVGANYFAALNQESQLKSNPQDRPVSAYETLAFQEQQLHNANVLSLELVGDIAQPDTALAKSNKSTSEVAQDALEARGITVVENKVDSEINFIAAVLHHVTGIYSIEDLNPSARTLIDENDPENTQNNLHKAEATRTLKELKHLSNEGNEFDPTDFTNAKTLEALQNIIRREHNLDTGIQINVFNLHKDKNRFESRHQSIDPQSWNISLLKTENEYFPLTKSETVDANKKGPKIPFKTRFFRKPAQNAASKVALEQPPTYVEKNPAPTQLIIATKAQIEQTRDAFRRVKEAIELIEIDAANSPEGYTAEDIHLIKEHVDESYFVFEKAIRTGRKNYLGIALLECQGAKTLAATKTNRLNDQLIGAESSIKATIHTPVDGATSEADTGPKTADDISQRYSSEQEIERSNMRRHLEFCEIDAATIGAAIEFHAFKTSQQITLSRDNQVTDDLSNTRKYSAIKETINELSNDLCNNARVKKDKLKKLQKIKGSKHLVENLEILLAISKSVNADKITGVIETLIRRTDLPQIIRAHTIELLNYTALTVFKLGAKTEITYTQLWELGARDKVFRGGQRDKGFTFEQWAACVNEGRINGMVSPVPSVAQQTASV